MAAPHNGVQVYLDGDRRRVDAFVAGSTTTQDSSTKVSYDTWAGASSKSASGRAYRVSVKANATSGLSFRGTSVQWITATGPAYGEAEVIVDGVNQGTVDLYSLSVNWQIAETYSGLASGPHTIVVKVLGIKNASSTGTKVVIDAFVISLTPLEQLRLAALIGLPLQAEPAHETPLYSAGGKSTHVHPRRQHVRPQRPGVDRSYTCRNASCGVDDERQEHRASASGVGGL